MFAALVPKQGTRFTKLLKNVCRKGRTIGVKVWRYMLPIRPAEPEITPSGYYR